MFLLYYRDFFEQICSDVQFISPPEEVGEFLLHLLKECQWEIKNLNATISCIFSLPREYVPPDGCVAGIIAASEKSGGLQRPEKNICKEAYGRKHQEEWI